MSTPYSSQGKTALQVFADIDATLSKEGLYVAVSRAKAELTIYTADKAKLHQRAQRSAEKENPSDYLPLFKLVNPHAQDSKAATATGLIHRRHRAQSIGNRIGERVEVSCQAPLSRAHSTQTRDGDAASTSASVRAAHSTDDRYFADLASGLERCVEPLSRAIEHCQQEREQQQFIQGLIETAPAIDQGLGQLERAAQARTQLTATVNQLARDVEAAAQRRRDRQRLRQEKAQAQAELERKQKIARDIYQQCAQSVQHHPVHERDRRIVRQLMQSMDTQGGKLKGDDIYNLGLVLSQGKLAQQVEARKGKETARDYIAKVIEAEMARAQRERERQRSRDTGIER